jgi:hypothetical protein
MGIAHLKQYSYITLMEEKGETLRSGKVANLSCELDKFLKGIDETRAAVEAVWPAIQSDHDIRVHYERRKKRKGANMAKVATARRLLTIIYRMLKEDRAYIPYKI